MFEVSIFFTIQVGNGQWDEVVNREKKGRQVEVEERGE